MKKHLISFVVDSSSSMYDKIDVIRKGLARFINCFLDNTDIAIITFGEGGSELILPPCRADELTQIPLFESGGADHICEGICKAINVTNLWIDDNDNNGFPYFKPWVVCLTDVDDVDSCIFWYDEHSRCITEIENTNAYFVMIGIGGNVCYDLLSKFSRTICPIKIDENNLVSFLDLLGQNVCSLLLASIENEEMFVQKWKTLTE